MHVPYLLSQYLYLSHYGHNVQLPLGAHYPINTEPHADLESFINDTLSEWHAAGMAVAVINGNKTEARGYGLASVDPPKPVTNSTLFYTGSTTKSFTAAAMSMLIDDKDKYPNLGWSTTIKSLIPEDFVTEDEFATSHLTIEDFLSHRSGYPRHDFSWPGKKMKEIMHNFRYLPRETEMRTKWEYCNLGFIVVSYIIEKLTGQWLGDLFREKLWAPMGMESTFLSLKDAQESGLEIAHPYWYDNDTLEYIKLPWVEAPEISGAGHTISNVLDYAKYVRVMMSQDGPISPNGHKDLRSPRSIMQGMDPDLFNGPMLYSLGWMMSYYQGERIIFHGGALDGFLTHMAYLPDRDWGIVTMTNTRTPAQEIVVYHMIDEYLEVPLKMRKDLSARARKEEKTIREVLKILPDLIYPTVPSPPLPLSLPLSNYSGTYFHPAYSNVTLYQNCSTTAVSVSCDAPLQSSLEHGDFLKVGLVMKHVSADFFLAYMSNPDHTNRTGEAVPLKAQFELDVTGVVSRVGIDLRMEGSGVPLVWFDRVG